MLRALPFQLKLMLGLLVILLIPVTCMLVLNLTYLRKSEIRRASTRLLSDAQVRSNLLEEELKWAITETILLSKRSGIEESLGPEADINSVNNELMISTLRQFLALSEGRFDEIKLLNYRGEELLNVSLNNKKQSSLQNYAQSPIFTRATLNTSNDPAEIKASIYAEVDDQGQQTGHLWFSKQLEGSDTGINGVIAIRMSRALVIRILSNTWSVSDDQTPSAHQFSQLLLVDDQGTIIFSSQDNSAAGNALSELYPENTKSIMQYRAGALIDSDNTPGLIQTFSKIDPQGIGNIQWRVIYEHPISSLVQETDQSTWVLLMSSILAVLLAILLMFILIRQTIAPLNRLSSAVSDLSEGRWNTMLPELKSKDEISNLTSAFNLMSSQISTSYQQLESTVEDLRQSQNELSANRQLLETVIDNAMVRIFVRTPDGQYLLTRSPDDQENNETDHRWDDTQFSTPELEQIKALDHVVLTTGERVSTEDSYVDTEGEHTFLTVSFPIRNQDHEIYAIGGMSMDITERKEAERILQRSHDDLEALVASRTKALEETQRELVRMAHRAGMSEVADNILHNIGNILNSVHSNLYMLEQQINWSDDLEALNGIIDLIHQHNSIHAFVDGDARAEQLPEFLCELSKAFDRHFGQMKEYLVNAQERMNHINNIINEQKSYASGTLLIEEVSISELINEAIDMASYRLENIQIATEIPDAIVWPIQRHRLLQVIVNLMINAVDAMVNYPGSGRIEMQCKVIEQQLVITITDYGPGVALELREHIFTSGFTTKQAGSGIGLHYCAVSMQHMGGKIELLDSDTGASFQLTLPQPAVVDFTRERHVSVSRKIPTTGVNPLR